MIAQKISLTLKWPEQPVDLLAIPISQKEWKIYESIWIKVVDLL